MTTFTLVPYQDSHREIWERTVAASTMATFLHSRQFLDYHGDRFRDESLLVRDGRDQVRAIFPCAVSAAHPEQVVSHPGATYGGLVYPGRPGAMEVVQMLQAIRSWYRTRGFTSLVYKTVPDLVQAVPAQIDRYALWRLNAPLYRRDLWNLLRLGSVRKLHKGRKWAINRARKHAVRIQTADTPDAYLRFHDLLMTCLAERHGVQPVHTAAEMQLLQNRFPDAIRLYLAWSATGELLAGTWIFRLNDQLQHTQYIAAAPAGRDCCAVDLLIETVIAKAEQEGCRYFSFGTSTENDGQRLNEGLFDFKAGFGLGAVTQDFHLLDLTSELTVNGEGAEHG